MTINVWYSLTVIAVTAVCTILLRAFPFLVFGGQKELPGTIKYLGDVLPASIMAVLVVYCLRNVDFTAAGHFVPSLVAGILVTGLHVWKKNIFLSIAAGTICYMILVQM